VLSEASFYGKPAILYSVNSRGSAAYLNLAKEIIARDEERKKHPGHPSSLQHLA